MYVLAGPTLGQNIQHRLSTKGCPGHPTLGQHLVQEMYKTGKGGGCQRDGKRINQQIINDSV